MESRWWAVFGDRSVMIVVLSVLLRCWWSSFIQRWSRLCLCLCLCLCCAASTAVCCIWSTAHRYKHQRRGHKTRPMHALWTTRGVVCLNIVIVLLTMCNLTLSSILQKPNKTCFHYMMKSSGLKLISNA